MNYDLTKLDDKQKNALVNARWASSETLWDKIEKIYKANTAVYSNESEWLKNIPEKRRNTQVQANRVFVNTEAVINSLIANPPGINILPAGESKEAQDFARKLENYFRKKYNDLNIKETMRMGYRNLYFARFFCVKAFWNPQINDFDFRTVDPRKVRVSKYARKEQDTEFAIEEIEDNICSVCERFPKKKEDIMKKSGFSGGNAESEMYIKNPDIKYKEAWIGDYIVFKYDNIILDTIKNPYWDWEGIRVTEEEEMQLIGNEQQPALEGEARRVLLQQIKVEQDQRQPQEAQEVEGVEGQVQPEAQQYKTYYYNYFDNPRKPYIFGTILNNENSPIGRTDFITLSSELQRGIDKRKMDIDENCDLMLGIVKVDASVMGKSDAQRIRWETRGIIWGKGVATGVTRETGPALPQMVFDDMLDSRQEIDNIMAASSAFKGEREGQETKAGRLALIQQSYLRLNELVQLGDYIYKEIFSWGMQMIKTRYTEYHQTEMTNKEGDREVIELIQDDIQMGNKVTIIAGKTLPVDDEFKFEQAQNDVKEGFISPVDYLDIAQYENSKELAKNAVAYKINPVVAVGIDQQQAEQLQPPQQAEPKAPSLSMSYIDLPPDIQAQVLEKMGMQANPEMLIAEKQVEQNKAREEMKMKADAQAHGQLMSERSQTMAEKEADKPVPKK